MKPLSLWFSSMSCQKPPWRLPCAVIFPPHLSKELLSVLLRGAEMQISERYREGEGDFNSSMS